MEKDAVLCALRTLLLLKYSEKSAELLDLRKLFTRCVTTGEPLQGQKKRDLIIGILDTQWTAWGGKVFIEPTSKLSLISIYNPPIHTSSLLAVIYCRNRLPITYFYPLPPRKPLPRQQY